MDGVARHAIGGRVSYEYETLEQFRREFPRDAAVEVRRFGAFGTAEAADRMTAYLRANTPINTTGDRPGHVDMASAWRRVRIAVNGGVIAQGGGLAYGIGNDAPHAGVINQGRRRNKRAYLVRRNRRSPRGGRMRRSMQVALGRAYVVKAGGRMLGSLQARRGVIAPAWRRLKAEQDAVAAVAQARYQGAG